MLSQVTDWAKLMPPLGISTRAKLAWRRFAVVELNGIRFALPAKGALAWLKSTGATDLTFDGYALRGHHGGSRIALLAYTTSVPCEESYEARAVVGGSGHGMILDRCELADMVTETATTSTLAERKADAKSKRIDKTRKAEREAVDRLARATTEAEQARAVVDSMTYREAVASAKRCRAAMRDYRAGLVEPFAAPGWLPVSFASEVWDSTAQDYVSKTLETVTVWGEYVAAYRAADLALQAYKPRIQWPSYVASLADEAGMSLAAYKRANPDRGFPIRGPQFDKLKEAKRQAFRALESFLDSRCTAYLNENGHRAYSRARSHLATWEQRKADLESQAFEARNRREQLVA